MSGDDVKQQAPSDQTVVVEREPAPRRIRKYPGDRTRIDRDQILGPGHNGKLWRITHVGEYDAENDCTEVVYAPLSTLDIDRIPGLRERLEFMRRQQAIAAGAVSHIGGM